ncbi:MAG TPA: glycosyltransferase family 39 protein, partial [Trichormus sp.]
MPTGERDKTEKLGAAMTATIALVPEAIGAYPRERLGDRQSRLRQRSRLWTVAFILIVALGIFFRFYKIDHKEYWCDEAYTSLMISGHVRDEFLAATCTSKPILAAAVQNEYQKPHGPTLSVVRETIAMGGHHPPLFFILARLWVERFGNSVAVMRILPALFSVMALPAVYWLCMELFESVAIARISVVLNAVSPFMVLHAQNLREYSLWMALIAASSAAFIRATKLQRRKEWIAYAILSAISFYTYTFSLFVSISHGLCVLWTEKLRLTRVTVGQLQAMVLTGVLCAPWLVVMAGPNVIEDMSWLEKKTTLPALTEFWKAHLTWIFAQGLYPKSNVILINSVLAFVAVCGCIMVMKAQRLQRNFVVCLIACSILPLLVPDLVFGGIRTVILRYMMPAVLGIFLIVSFGISRMLAANAKPLRAIGSLALGALIAIGIASCLHNSDRPRPSQFSVNQDLAAMARVINASPKVLMVCNVDSQPGQTLALVRLLRGDIPLLFVKGPDATPMPAGLGSIYVFNADPMKGLKLGMEYDFDRSSATPCFGTIS